MCSVVCKIYHPHGPANWSDRLPVICRFHDDIYDYDQPWRSAGFPLSSKIRRQCERHPKKILWPEASDAAALNGLYGAWKRRFGEELSAMLFWESRQARLGHFVAPVLRLPCQSHGLPGCLDELGCSVNHIDTCKLQWDGNWKNISAFVWNRELFALKLQGQYLTGNMEKQRLFLWKGASACFCYNAKHTKRCL